MFYEQFPLFNRLITLTYILTSLWRLSWLFHPKIYLSDISEVNGSRVCQWLIELKWEAFFPLRNSRRWREECSKMDFSHYSLRVERGQRLKNYRLTTHLYLLMGFCQNIWGKIMPLILAWAMVSFSVLVLCLPTFNMAAWWEQVCQARWQSSPSKVTPAEKYGLLMCSFPEALGIKTKLFVPRKKRKAQLPILMYSQFVGYTV